MDMEWKVEESIRPIIVYFKGSFEETDSSFLRETIKEKLDEENKTDLIVNLSKLEYLNSTSLNVFVQVYSECLKSGVKIMFSDLSPSVKNLFKMTSLDVIVPVYRDNDEAMRRNYRM
ncbi:MAG: STAS domain-containing protein [Candidatus Muiribacteriaceae bacterium]